MSKLNPESKFSTEPHENNSSAFMDKFRELLSGIAFEESTEMIEARTAVLEALARPNRSSEFLRSIWVEYARICEQSVDDATPSNADPQIRARLQIAALIYKALIFREIGDLQRYDEDLTDIEEYAFTKQLDEVAEAIGKELDSLES